MMRKRHRRHLQQVIKRWLLQNIAERTSWCPQETLRQVHRSSLDYLQSVQQDALRRIKWGDTSNLWTEYGLEQFDPHIVLEAVDSLLKEPEYREPIICFEPRHPANHHLHQVGRAGVNMHQRRQRKVKQQQRSKVKQSQNKPKLLPLAHDDTIHPIELEPTRQPHRQGFGSSWQPTRKRYWRSVNNNWKQRHRCHKQWMKHL